MSGSGSVLIKVIQDRGLTADAAAMAGTKNGDGSGDTSGSGAQNFIRRPTRGIQIRENTYATIRLIALVGGKNKKLIDAGSRRPPGIVDGKSYTDIYSNFLIQSVSEERQEKSQVLETFGEPYIFLFGERPRMLTIQGVLINTSDFNWEAEWWHNYENYLRGTQAVNADARMYIQYEQNLVGGYILSCNSAKSVGEPYTVGFSFQMFVTSYTNFSDVGNPDARKGNRFLAKNSGKTTSTDISLADALATEMRPTLIDNTNSFSTQNAVTAFNKPLLSLPDSFKSSIDSVVNAFSKVNSLLNTVKNVAGQFSLAPIRIPVGFAGASTFDTDNVKVNYISADYYKVDNKPLVIKYSVYKDNNDEYVGVSDHYGSSQSFDSVMNLGFETLNERLSFGTKMVKKLTAQWAAAGYPVELNALATEARALVDGSLGLLVSTIAPLAIGVTENALALIPRIASETPQPPMHLATSPVSGTTITLTNPVPPPPPIGSASPPLGAQIFSKAKVASQ